MTTHLVTFSDESMSRSRELCAESAFTQGVTNACLWSPEQLVDSPIESLLPNRGCGWWSWKPYIILDTMGRVSENDFIVYGDAGIEFINNINYIIDRMDQDIFLFGNQWEHAHWCKRDIIEAIMPGTPWDAFGKQVQASVIFLRVNDKTRRFVWEWLNWCLFRTGGERGAPRYLIDDSPSLHPNHPEFRENRHDQAILTTLAYRDGIKLHWWPAQYNDGAFTYERGDYPDEGYPVLFSHHRKRDHEWEKVA